MTETPPPPEGGSDEAPRPSADLYNAADSAAYLGISERHFLRLVDRGDAPRPVRLGRLCRWPRATLAEWVAGGCKPCRERRPTR